MTFVLWQRCKATQSPGCLRSTSLTFVGCRSRFSTRRRREESLHAQTRRAQNRPDPYPVNAKISAPLGSAEGSEIVNQWSRAKLHVSTARPAFTAGVALMLLWTRQKL